MAAVALARLLLWLCVRRLETTNTRVSLGDDVLRPYAVGHGPAHSHRHVRDCQLAVHGNATHETRPASTGVGGAAPVESTVFVSDVPGSSRQVYGHVTVVRDPLRTLSVLEPGGPGGCERNRGATVEETASGGCMFAQNAGFFHPEEHRCFGNVVSDGRLARDGGGVQNAQFGIRRDGSLVFGYLSQQDVLDQSNPFLQLVSGVVWLLRNGELYINQSLEAECDATQRTGRFLTFVNVVSARTAVGHDAEGNVVLFHVDGQTGARGMTLWEVAESLRGYGVINAINLDGGGSSTYVANGSLSSYPSDHCKADSRWRCARAVSTVLCVHPRRCEPADCGGHGDCTAEGCGCAAGWRGNNCSQAGRCLAKRMFTLWRRDEEARRERPRLTESAWLALSSSLAALLLLSLLLHLLRARRGSVAPGAAGRPPYAYVPLSRVNGAAGAGRSCSAPEDSDSQDEIWSPSEAGGS